MSYGQLFGSAINVGAINAISPPSYPPVCPFMLPSLPPLDMYAYRVFCMLCIVPRTTIISIQLLLNAVGLPARANLLVGHYIHYIMQHWYS